MNTYDPLSHRTVVARNGETSFKFYAVNKLLRDMDAAGLVHLVPSVDEPADQTAIWLDISAPEIEGGVPKAFSGGSWVAVDRNLFLSHLGGDLALGYVAENAANKGQPNGYAELDGSGQIPAGQLPSYVDDVLEFANIGAFPATGETSKIYVALDTNKSYRWTGTIYVEISASPGSTDAVPEGTTNLYFTAARVLATVLAGLSTASSAVVTAADTILAAIGKLQAQVSLKLNAAAVSAFGLTLVDDADAATARGTLGLGTLATQSGTFSGTSSGTNTGDQTITLTGNVTGSGIGSFAATIANDAVTFAKMQNIPTLSLIGRNTAAAGDPEPILLNATLEMDGALNLRRAALTGDITSAAGSNATTLASVNGNVGTFGSASSVGQFTVNAKGLMTSASSVAIAVASGAITDATVAGKAMLTAASAAAQTALLSVFVGDSGSGGTKGLVPPPAPGDASKFLRGDGTFAAIPGGGDALTANPLSQFATSTTAAIGVGTIDLGDASDTTLSRSAAGVVAVEGVDLIKADNTILTAQPSLQVFTSSGTWTRPTGCRQIRLRVIGGGAGGSGATAAASASCCGAGGAAGSYSEGIFDVTAVSTASVTVGAAGAAGAAANGAGGAGGTSAFGSLITGVAGGGAGGAMASGTAVAYATGGIPGAAGSGGAVNWRGGTGHSGFRSSASVFHAGAGAAGPFGGAGRATNAAAVGGAGLAPGAGGAGAASNSATGFAGGAGAAGIVIVEEFY